MQPEFESHLMPIVKRPAPVMVRGAGSYLWDEGGARYLDFIQGWAVNALGHAPPEVVAALSEQAAKLLTPSPALHNAPQLALARRLVQLSGLHQACFVSSGAEAVEVAIKLARKWGRLHRGGAYEIVTTLGAFHGRTLAAMAASGKPGWDALFPPALPGFTKVAFGDVDAMRAAITDRTAALLVEPIQGEGGVVVPPAGYLGALRELADERGVLLMLDEIQTGMGRTGHVFAHQADGIRPDVMTLGKGLGGGVPIAATLASERASVFEPGDQGGTYAGNPLTTATALTVVDVICEPEFLQTVRQRGEELSQGLASVSERHGGAQVRGRGLLWALRLGAPVAELVRDACLASGLLVNAAQSDVLRFMPSLRVSSGEIAQMLACLDCALSRVADQAA
jgi:acetylornithine/N-succinyldiaminopimelate aminotransferase